MFSFNFLLFGKTFQNLINFLRDNSKNWFGLSKINCIESSNNALSRSNLSLNFPVLYFLKSASTPILFPPVLFFLLLPKYKTSPVPILVNTTLLYLL